MTLYDISASGDYNDYAEKKNLDLKQSTLPTPKKKDGMNPLNLAAQEGNLETVDP